MLNYIMKIRKIGDVQGGKKPRHMPWIIPVS
jgi:hypothetical protein